MKQLNNNNGIGLCLIQNNNSRAYISPEYCSIDKETISFNFVGLGG